MSASRTLSSIGDRAAWTATLASTTLRVPDASEAADYHAQLLGGYAAAGRVALASGTALDYVEGSLGVAAITLRPAEPPAAAGEMLVDPDGREVRLMPAYVARELEADAPRLGHVTFETPDPLAAQAWFERLGFVLSEGLADRFRWLRCNPVHHTVAFSKAAQARTHHVGIEVPDRAALVDVCDRLSEAGEAVEYGPGRHLVGNNLFIYFVDRYGIRFEVFCELERIPDPARPPLIHEKVDRARSINVWGPQPTGGYWDGF